jgi:hypothetical protein
MTSALRMARRLLGTVATVGAASVAVGCAGEVSSSGNLATLYIYADYASPNVAVSVNGTSLGVITQQYTGGGDCTVLAGKGLVDGVVRTQIHGNVHYSINWTYSSGATDSHVFDATPDFFGFPCLLQPIEAPAASPVPSGVRVRPATRFVSGRDR